MVISDFSDRLSPLVCVDVAIVLEKIGIRMRTAHNHCVIGYNLPDPYTERSRAAEAVRNIG